MHVCMKPLFAPNKVLVSDEGGGLPGRQRGGLPSSQDAADYLLSGFTDCYRFTVGFNKHHQGVKTFGEWSQAGGFFLIFQRCLRSIVQLFNQGRAG